MSELASTSVVLVGAGKMRATLSALLERLEPDWLITLIESLDVVAAERSSFLEQCRPQTLRTMSLELYLTKLFRCYRHH